MDRARIHEGICQMRLVNGLGRRARSELSQAEAAELLGVGARTFRRWRDRHRDAGDFGLRNRRPGPSPLRAARTVSTTLRQPGLEFTLFFLASLPVG